MSVAKCRGVEIRLFFIALRKVEKSIDILNIYMYNINIVTIYLPLIFGKAANVLFYSDYIFLYILS